MTDTPRRRRRTGAQRQAEAKKAAKLYRAGRTVRQVAEHLGCSYGCAHRLIREGGATMRPRGGGRR